LNVPSRGDLGWIQLNPQAGREQANHRPCIVLTEQAFNRITGLAIVAPITNKVKNYAFELPIPGGYQITGTVLTDQIKSLDYHARQMHVVDRIPDEDDFIKELLDRVSGFFSR
jgi:mRNA interferase MazF